MTSVSVRLGLALLVSAGTLAGMACASDRRAFDDVPPPSPLVSEDAQSEPSCEDTVRCSRDLKRVLRHGCDGTEEVVAECGPDRGCGEGACIDACKSAELSKGSIGCSFATLPPDGTIGNRAPASGSCFAALIANVWDRPAKLDAMLGADPIDIGSSTYYVNNDGSNVSYPRAGGAIAPGKVAVVFLANSPPADVPCPDAVVPALREDPISHGTSRTRAFRLTSDVPVSAYSIWPYGGAGSFYPTATLLLPVSAWDNNYVTVSAWTRGTAHGGAGQPFIQIVASEENTEVRMRPSVNIIGGSGVPGVIQGQTQTWVLGRGEVLQIKQPQDPSGSQIETSKPVGLFGGSDCANIPFNECCCDTTQQQIPAVTQWGSAYALVPYRPRTDFGEGTTSARELVPWRFVGAADGTTLTYDPARPLGAPEALEAGQVVTFMSRELVAVRSQDAEHAFHASMFMTGPGPTPPRTLGDPEFVNVVPSEQFLDRYIFFVDHTYPETTLTLVRRKTGTGFRPVFLECAGEVTDFKPLGVGGEYEFAWVYLTKSGVPKRFDGGTCGYGRHEAHSDGPFSVHVWGTGTHASYGYAGGQGSRPLNSIKGPPVN